MAQSILKFTRTTINDFAIIKNGVDDRIEIIQHVDTGFYNITKMLKLVSGLKREEQNDDATRIPVGSEKGNLGEFP